MPTTASPRVVVVGSGIAGLTAALRIAGFAQTTLITKGALQESNTLYAQGGIAAAIFEDDSVDLHVADTLRAGAGLADEETVRILCSEGPGLVRELLRMGVPFDRDGEAPARGLEAAHSRARILHAGGDATGRAIELTLAARAREAGIRILERTMLTDLVVERSRVIGARTVDDRGRIGVLGAEAVVLATGGAGRLYTHTTNPAGATGDGVAAAWRAGAELADLEFYQFHPTALAVPGGTLVSEAVRGEGAVLVDGTGTRFMPGVHPDAELAPRDVVARAIADVMERQGGAPALLDATGLDRGFLARRFPTIQAACEAAGLDWAEQPIPVTPAAHYWMGGVKTDAWARTCVPGLLAVGEVACTGAQGANRLASNSLLEGLVFAARAADALSATDLPRSPLADASQGPIEWGPYAGPVPGRTEALRELMWRYVGVERDAEGLRHALGRMEELGRAVQPEDAPRATTGFAEHEERNLLTLGALVARAALARRESRGAHYRRDFPEHARSAAHSVIVDRPGGPAESQQRDGKAGLVTEAVPAC